ncbi:hypothetical protein [Demequina capsici]|uniref:Uncharacterized protein n=1 Tax=Demequina capsici TaxID=3075620 RepID=A0AA96F9B6_9MICO|nr:hypothetical protein [Demequina sp. OYTSA14]WNM25090.1 hypothetical protein RN606_02790 [Demequina sp. OYTSA14]
MGGQAHDTSQDTATAGTGVAIAQEGVGSRAGSPRVVAAATSTIIAGWLAAVALLGGTAWWFLAAAVLIAAQVWLSFGRKRRVGSPPVRFMPHMISGVIALVAVLVVGFGVLIWQVRSDAPAWALTVVAAATGALAYPVLLRLRMNAVAA